MKHAKLAFLVVMAVIVGFTGVHAVQAIELEGIVLDPTECPECVVSHAELLINEINYGPIILSGVGPKAYWRSQGLDYPGVGDYLYIDAHEGRCELVAVTVCYERGRGCIELRDPDTLIPLWISFQVTDTADALAAESSGDCPGCPGCDVCQPKDYNYGNDYNYNYLAPGPHRR